MKGKNLVFVKNIRIDKFFVTKLILKAETKITYITYDLPPLPPTNNLIESSLYLLKNKPLFFLFFFSPACKFFEKVPGSVIIFRSGSKRNTYISDPLSTDA